MFDASPATTTGNATRVRRAAMLAAAAVSAVLAGVSPANAAVDSLQFVDTVHAAAVGMPFAEPIAVTVRDENGPVEGVQVTFSVQPDSTGATAQLSATTAATDAAGVAVVSVTAGATPGFPQLVAQTQEATAWAQLVNRPPGYLPGERLATIEAVDQDGESETVKAAKGKTFLLVDVCASWCGPCRHFAEQAQAAIAQLAMLGIEVELVTLLAEGNAPWTVSTQTDAVAWKQSLGLTGSVLHADGSPQSALYRSAFFTLYAEGDNASFPTHLLVDPKGTILDRRMGADSTEQTIERVLQYAKAKQPNRAPAIDSGEVSVILPDGASYSHRFTDFGFETVDQGFLMLDGADGSNVVSRSWTYLATDAAVLADDGSMQLSLTRFRSEVGQRLVSGSARVEGGMALFDAAGTEVQAFLVASTTMPASQQGGTVSVEVSLPALRSALKGELEAGRYRMTYGHQDAPLTADQIDAVLEAVYSVGATVEYLAK